jgi:hypothetical protein
LPVEAQIDDVLSGQRSNRVVDPDIVIIYRERKAGQEWRADDNACCEGVRDFRGKPSKSSKEYRSIIVGALQRIEDGRK